MRIDTVATLAALQASAAPPGSLAFARDTASYHRFDGAAWSTLPTLAALLAATPLPATLAILAPLPLGAERVTVPACCVLRFEDGGTVVIAGGQALVVEGGIEAGAQRIFDTADASAFVDFRGAGKTALRPEWWGARGDGEHDDADAIQQAFDCPSALDQHNEIVFTAGKTYRIRRGIRVGNAARAGLFACSCIVRGDGARVLAEAAALGTTPAFSLGHFADGSSGADAPVNAKLFRLDWQGLSVARDTVPADGEPAEASTGIALAWCDFASFRHFLVSGFHTGIRYVEDGGNSNVFEQVDVVAAVVGARIGGTPDGNGWRWIGGKVQQCTIGLHASGASVSVADTDFSLCRTALLGEALSEASLKFYSEGVATGPANDNAVLELQRCTNVLLQASRINGAHRLDDNAAFGVRLRGCRAVRIATNLFTRHQTADIHVDADCEGIVIDTDNRQATLVAAGDGRLRQVDKLRVDDRTHGRIDDRQRLRDLPWRGEPAWAAPAALNLLASPHAFDHPGWALAGGAAHIGYTLGPDGSSPAQVLRLPEAPQAMLSLAALPHLPVAPGVTRIVLRWWWQAQAMPALPQPRRGLRSYLQCGTAAPDWDWSYLDADGVYTGHGAWQFEEHVFVPRAGEALALLQFQASNFFGAAVEIALWGVQLFATDDARRHVPVLVH